MIINVQNNSIFSLLQKETTYERCGLIFGFAGRHEGESIWSVHRFIEVPNTHEDRANQFQITKEHAALAKSKSRLWHLGYWHTHIHEGEEEPSPWDIEQMARYPDHIGMTYHVPTGTVSWFTMNGIINNKEYIF